MKTLTSFLLCLFLVLFTPGFAAAWEEEDHLATNVIIVFDTSGSMRGQKIIDARDAIDAFLSGLRGDFNVGLITFTRYGQPEILVPLKFLEETGEAARRENQNSIREKVKKLDANGPTPLTLCMQKALEQLGKRAAEHPYERQLVVLVTDGMDTVSGPDSVAPMMERMTEKGISISLIAFDTRENEYLRKFATRYFQPNNKTELSAALGETLSEATAFTTFGK